MGLYTLSSPSARSITAAAAAILATGIILRQRNALTSYYRRHRGMSGLLRMAWQGDFLPPQLRNSMDELDKIEERMGKSEEQLEQIDILVEKARLDSVDFVDDDDVNQEELKTFLFQQNPDLRTRIGIFSNKLDTLAAMIDAIESNSDDEVKQRKKQLSNKIVELMNELDNMLGSLGLEMKDK